MRFNLTDILDNALHKSCQAKALCSLDVENNVVETWLLFWGVHFTSIYSKLVLAKLFNPCIILTNITMILFCLYKLPPLENGLDLNKVSVWKEENACKMTNLVFQIPKICHLYLWTCYKCCGACFCNVTICPVDNVTTCPKPI